MRGVMRPGTAEENEAVFRDQPPGATVGLPMLKQGHAIDEAGHASLVARWEAAWANGATTPACPPCYVAWRLEPHSVEFYSGGHAGFMNDRYLYVRQSGSGPTMEWQRLRLQA